MVKWAKGYNPDQIANRIEAVKSIDQNGNVTFKGFDYLDHTVLLNSMIDLENEIPQLEINQIIRQSIFKAREERSCYS